MIRLQKKPLPSPLFELALQFTSEAEDKCPGHRGQDSVHSENAENTVRNKSELAHAYNPSHSEAEVG